MSSTTRRLAAAGALAGALLLGSTPAALADDVSLDESVTAVTGLAADTGRGVYWSADRTAGVVRAFTPDGALAGQVSYGARVSDVEATIYQGSRVWMADIGDADESRDTVSVLRIGDLGYGTTALHRRYVLSYPDQPQDARAMAVSPSGRIHVATRGNRPGLYRTGEPVSGGQPNRMERLADMPENTTDMVFSGDGKQLVVRTLTSVHVYDATTWRELASAGLPATAQGEALAMDLSGGGLVVSGQGSPVPLAAVELPTALSSLGPAPATPTPVPADQASASATPGATDQDGLSAAASNLGTNLGTKLALAAAALISLLAAGVVVAKR